MECPKLEVSDVELESRLEGRRIGMAATFSCPVGFTLSGERRIACRKSGESDREYMWEITSCATTTDLQ